MASDDQVVVRKMPQRSRQQIIFLQTFNEPLTTDRHPIVSDSILWHPRGFERSRFRRQIGENVADRPAASNAQHNGLRAVIRQNTKRNLKR